MKLLYRIYQLFFALPLGLLATLLTAIITSVGCLLGSAHFWGYYPAMLWSRFICRILLLPIRIKGNKHVLHNRSYVFVANHQGSMDIFLIYGYLGRNFKWMMKQSLRRIPFVGYACQKARHIFVDNSKASKIKQTIEQGRETLQDGTSLVVFPEGARTFTGKMRNFRRGAFVLAHEIGLPIVPLTINGSFKALPRTKGFFFVERTPLTLTIHEPIDTTQYSTETLPSLIERTHTVIASALEE
ncbi:MAG: 1-acyl-sn-glycerol-3-phosphate acyltransferase [Alloprevotella sp.]|nr:1-acyl-sn-glycerol-3-phosphate acyltransferase [Alloprevotella sp.]